MKELIRDPIYQQLNRILRELIAGKDFNVGDKFLTERMISEQYDVSRATANKALSNLVSEGLLEFKKGVGTFIRHQPTKDESSSLISFTANVKRAGMKPKTQVLRFEKIYASEVAEAGVMKQLRLKAGDEVYLIERLRLADEIPMMIEHRYLVAKHCQGLTKQMLKGSLYSLFEKQFKLNVTNAEESIQAVTIKGRQAKLLDVPSGKAGFLVSSVGYIESGIPLWSHSWKRRMGQRGNNCSPTALSKKWNYGENGNQRCIDPMVLSFAVVYSRFRMNRSCTSESSSLGS
ncbi:hypothetical protein ES708_05028 [subsurface metagenome]